MRRAHTWMEFDSSTVTDKGESVAKHLQQWTDDGWRLEHACESMTGHIVHCGYYWIKDD